MLDLVSATALLRVLSDPTRVRLLALLRREELTVAELSSVLRLAQPRVSTHLAKLKESGLVRDRRAGVSAYYRFNESGFDGAADLLRALDDDVQRLPSVLAARARPRLGRQRGRRHGASLLTGPHLGNPRPHVAAIAGDRRRTGYRVGRRRAGRTAGTPCALDRVRGFQPQRGGGRAQAPQGVPQRRSDRRRHARTRTRESQVRSRADDARAHLQRAPAAGDRGGRACLETGGTPAGGNARETRTPRGGGAVRPQESRFQARRPGRFCAQGRS